MSDRLDESQHPQGFLTQSAFTGLAQTLSYLAPSILVWLGMNRDATDGNAIPQIVKISFLIGAVLSLVTILYSVTRVRELPLTPTRGSRHPRPAAPAWAPRWPRSGTPSSRCPPRCASWR